MTAPHTIKLIDQTTCESKLVCGTTDDTQFCLVWTDLSRLGRHRPSFLYSSSVVGVETWGESLMEGVELYRVGGKHSGAESTRQSDSWLSLYNTCIATNFTM